MEIYPAIDLMNGRCVRLSGGDFDARKIYEDDPCTVARQYRAAGARWLHLVDLDGARDPKNRQSRMIETLALETDLNIQTGGGVRTAQDVDDLLKLGVARVIIGSLCVQNPELTAEILKKYGPEKIVLAFDVRGDFEKGFFLTTSGWKDTSEQRLESMLAHYNGLVRHILCTDISRDGFLGGPHVELYAFLCKHVPDVLFQASGGVARLADLDDLKAAGAAGAIIGKALYEKKFTINDALKQVA